MDLNHRLQLERDYHESDDKARGDNSLINGVYGSGLFDEAESYHLDALGDIRGAQVLDYGCGAGFSTAKLAARGAAVAAFDISLTRLAEARHYLSERSSPAPLLASAAERLPFVDSSFDVIYGKQVLHHLDLRLAIPEILRVLRPRGRAAFLEPLIHNPILESYRRRTPHLRSPTEKALHMNDLQWIGSHFTAWSHQEFCLLAVLPVLFDLVVLKRPAQKRVRLWLQKLDRALVKTAPSIGRFCWETVIVLER